MGLAGDLSPPFSREIMIESPTLTVEDREAAIRVLQEVAAAARVVQLGGATERRELELEIAKRADDERRWLGLELHESIAQQLTGLALMAEAWRSKLRDVDSKDEARVGELLGHIRDLQKQIRHLAQYVLPVEVDSEGLMAALRRLCSRTSDVPGTSCRFDCEDRVAVEDNMAATNLYHIAEEAVRLAVHQAKSAEVVVRLEQRSSSSRPRDLVLSIRGTGATDVVVDSEAEERIMRYWANLIGAKLKISSRRDRDRPSRAAGVARDELGRPERDHSNVRCCQGGAGLRLGRRGDDLRDVTRRIRRHRHIGAGLQVGDRRFLSVERHGELVRHRQRLLHARRGLHGELHCARRDHRSGVGRVALFRRVRRTSEAGDHNGANQQLGDRLEHRAFPS